MSANKKPVALWTKVSWTNLDGKFEIISPLAKVGYWHNLNE